MHDVLYRLHSAAIPYIFLDPGVGGTIAPNRQFAVCEIETAGAEARTLADPEYVGQRLTLAMLTDGGDATITADSDIDQSGNNVITMDDVGDLVDLVGIRDSATTFAWRILANVGCTLS